MKIIKLLIVFMVSLQSAMMVNCSDQILTPAQQRQDIIDVAMAPENYVDLKQDLAFLESQNLLRPHSFLNLLEENVTESQDADFNKAIEKAEDLITQQMRTPFISTLQRALKENTPLAYITNPVFAYVIQRKDSDMILQNIVHGWLLEWSTTKNSKGATPLHLAAENGHIEILQMLITAGANVNIQTTDIGATSLHIAADNGHTETVRLLIDAGANVNIQTTDYEFTPLHIAALIGYTETVRLLIDAGANVNIQTTDYEFTPLHIAAQRSHTEIVKLLIAAAANVDSQTTDSGSTPLHIAALIGHTEIVQLLIAAGANVNIQTTHNGATPLYIAVENDHTEIVRLLITAGANVDSQRTDNGITPLYTAAYRGRAKTVHLLIEHGADITLGAHNGRTAEDVAQTDEIRELFRQVRQRQQEQKDARKIALFENQIKKDWR